MTDYIIILEEEDGLGPYPSEAYIVKNVKDPDEVEDRMRTALEDDDYDIDEAILIMSIPNADKLTAEQYLGEDFSITVI